VNRCLGWREWLELPDLAIDHIKAKVDTGARTSALHADQIEVFQDHGREMVRFVVHPVQKRKIPAVVCECPVVDRRRVSDSGGHAELRYVIETRLQIGDFSRMIEVTLTNRTRMSFRMLLGRSALAGFIIYPDRSYLGGINATMRQQ